MSMRTNQKKPDQNNDQNTQAKNKTSTPRNKKAQQPIQSQKQSLKIGDKITSNGIVQQSQSIKSDPKIPCSSNYQDDFSRFNKLEKQQSGNRDKQFQDSAQNYLGNQVNCESPKGFQFFNNSINLIQPEFPPLFLDEGLAGGNNPSSGSLSNSSGQAKKQRVIIKQSISQEAKQVQGFEQAGFTNGDNQNRIQRQKSVGNDRDGHQMEMMQGMNFSFIEQNERHIPTDDNQNNPNLLSTVKITPSGQQQNQTMNIQQQHQQQYHNQQQQENSNRIQRLEDNQVNQNLHLKLEKKDSKKTSNINRDHSEINQIRIQNFDEDHSTHKNNLGSNGYNNNSNQHNHHNNNQNNSNQQRQNQNLLVNPLQQQQNMGSGPINSITGSHGDKQKTNFSLADQLVVKKSGKYLDEYENVEGNNSQQDDKKLIMLGRGGFGQVYLIKQRGGNKEERAMKVIMKQYQESMREVMILKKFSHPNVLKIYEYFEDDQNIYVITERCFGYNLFDYIIRKGQFKESETCKIADGVLRALAEAHKQNIVHRDIKPENIMLDFNDASQSFIVKLIDWGLAEQIQGENKYLTKRCGTLHYLAPEVLAKKYNEKVDLWSLGMVLFTLIQGSPPICGKSQMDILEQINDFRCDFRYHCWKDISEEGKDLILKLLDRDQNKRISATEALKHPWFTKFLGTTNINTQDLRVSYDNLLKYASQNAFKKTILGFFASHVVSKRERNKYIEIFQALDTDKNGELSIDELKAGFSKLFGEQELAFCQEKIEYIFFDSLSSKFENASGIKYEEFLSSMLACSATYSQEQLYDAFQIFDKDKNGKITLNEITETLGIQEHSDLINCFKEIIDESDMNQDGEIDFEEFRSIMTNFLDKHSQDLLSQDIYL